MAALATTTATTTTTKTVDTKETYFAKLAARRRREDVEKAIGTLVDTFYRHYPECESLDESFVDALGAVVDHFPEDDVTPLREMIQAAELDINVHGGVLAPDADQYHYVETFEPEWPEEDDGDEGPVRAPKPKAVTTTPAKAIGTTASTTTSTTVSTTTKATATTTPAKTTKGGKK